MWRKIIARKDTTHPYYVSKFDRLRLRGHAELTLDCGHKKTVAGSKIPKKGYVHCKECKAS